MRSTFSLLHQQFDEAIFDQAISVIIKSFYMFSSRFGKFNWLLYQLYEWAVRGCFRLWNSWIFIQNVAGIDQAVAFVSKPSYKSQLMCGLYMYIPTYVCMNIYYSRNIHIESAHKLESIGGFTDKSDGLINAGNSFE